MYICSGILHTHTHTHKHTDTYTDRLSGIQTNRQTDRQTDKPDSEVINIPDRGIYNLNENIKLRGQSTFILQKRNSQAGPTILREEYREGEREGEGERERG